MAERGKSIVLVHGGFVGGSGWEGVYNILRKDGYTVAIVQNPTLSLADDVAVAKRTIAVQTGSVILVGHSYGGAVITEAGNDPKSCGARLYHGLCAGQWRAGFVSNQGPAARRAGAAEPAAARRLSVPRQNTVRGFIRG